MAEFGPNVTEAPSVPVSSTVKEPVAPSNAGLKAISNIFDAAIAVKDKRRQGKVDELLASFQNEQLKIVDAVDQGMDPLSGRTRLRTNLARMTEAYPSLRDDLIKINSGIIGEAGLGFVVKEDSREERLFEEQADILLKEGLITSRSSATEISNAWVEYSNSLRGVEAYEARMRVLDEKLKNGQLTRSQIETINAERKFAAERLLSDIGPSEYGKFSSYLSELINSEGSSQEKLIALDTRISQMQQQFSAYMQDLDSVRADAWWASFNTLAENAKSVISGELDQKVYETRLANAKTIMEQRLLDDPRIAEAYAMSVLFKNNAIMEQQAMNRVSQYFLDSLNGTPPAVINTEEKGAVSRFLNLVGKPQEEGTEGYEEQKIHVSNLLDVFEDAEGKIRKNPANAITLIEWIASPEGLRMHQAHPEVFQSRRDAVNSVLSNHFDNEVLNLINKQFKDAKVSLEGLGIGRTTDGKPSASTGATHDKDKFTPVPEAVGVRITPSGFQFYAYDPENRTSSGKAKQLNKSLKPVINMFVRSKAHLDGSTNYSQYYKQAGEMIFGAENVDVSPDNDLTVEDFNTSVRVEEVTPTGVDLIDTLEGTNGNYDTLLSNSQNSEFSGVEVSRMTLDEVIQFSSEGGDYANYSKGQVGRMATPMGRYQIVGTTLRAVKEELGLSGDTIFSKDIQDKMFLFLARRRLKGATSMSAKRKALRAEWEGFKNATDEALNKMILEIESNV